jgi:hypothetical protein
MRGVLIAWLVCTLATVISEDVQPANPDHSCVGLCNSSRPDLCDTIGCKTPRIGPMLVRAETVETGLTNATKAEFEFGVARALGSTRPVQWTFRQVGLRMYKMIEKMSELNQTSFEDSLLTAFAGGDAHNAGFVGPNATTIKKALLSGNIREVLALVYLISETKWVTKALLEGLEGADGWTDIELEQIGLVPAVVRSRHALVNTTMSLPPEDRYNGVPTFLFASFDSWVRFDYPGPDENADPTEWEPIRLPIKPHCNETSIHSDNRLISPPLSAAELSYQCNGKPSCKLQWYPGGLCYTLQDLPFRRRAAEPEVPGFIQRLAALGWRSVAGPSGTTATVLQLGQMLGLDPRLMRLVMMAWMVRTYDHSFYEIMLGADPFMPRGWSLNYTMADFGSLMPDDIHIEYNAQSELFTQAEVWSAVVNDWLLTTPSGLNVMEKMNPNQVAYLLSLVVANSDCTITCRV